METRNSALVVDRYASTRRALARMLGNWFAKVRVAATAETALRLLGTGPVPAFDLVTTELNLPSMDGLQFIAEVQRRFGARAPRIVVISAYSDDQAAAEDLRVLDIRTVLLKPVFASTLHPAVTRS